MVVGGCCAASNLVELVSLNPEHPVPDCLSDLNSFPFEIYAAAGSSLPGQGKQYCPVMSEVECHCINCTKNPVLILRVELFLKFNLYE
jgi:hypothetical protein